MTKRQKIAKAQGRPVTEWVGKRPDSMPPPTVMQRIWDRQGGLCAISGLPIGKKKWDREHIKPLEDGGENRESNIQIALRVEHLKKTVVENQNRKKADRKKQADIGAKPPPQRPLQSRDFPETVKSTKKLTKTTNGPTAMQRRYLNV